MVRSAGVRYFVTGATGFIGRHLCRRLVADGHEVVALVRDPEKAVRVLGAIETLTGDLSIFRARDIELPAFDVVVHLAAVVAGKNEAEYHEVNHQAVVDLVDALERQAWEPRRFLFASSLAAGGPTVATRPLREDDPSGPIDAYGIAKLRAERRVAEASFPTTSFRPSIVLGPGDDATLTLYRMARSGWVVRVAGVDQVVSFVDVDDLVEAIVLMAEEATPEHRVYYVAHDEAVRTSDLLATMGRALGKRVTPVPVPKAVLRCASFVATAASKVLGFQNQLDEKQYRQMTAPAFVCSTERLQRSLGWRARIGLEPSIAKAVAGYRAEGRL